MQYDCRFGFASDAAGEQHSKWTSASNHIVMGGGGGGDNKYLHFWDGGEIKYVTFLAIALLHGEYGALQDLNVI